MMIVRHAAWYLALIVLLGAVTTLQAHAQHHGGHRPGSAPASPYAGMQAREIKALSEPDMADLRAGRGMGLALAAVLNGHPGPMHALEHADALGLDADQRARLSALVGNMRTDAIAASLRVIEAARALDRLFASGAATPEAVRAATAAVAVTQGELRSIHLVTHIATRTVLTQPQLTRYDVLRGYRQPG